MGTEFAFVGPNPPTKCLEHIRVCLVTFRLSSRYAAIHLRRLSCPLIPGAYCLFRHLLATVESNICNVAVFDWVLFLSLAVGTVVGMRMMFRHFLREIEEITS